MSTLPLRAEQAETPEPIKRTFWQRPFVQDGLPFLTSLMLHLGLIALGILTYKAVVVMTAVSVAPPMIPDSVPLDQNPTDRPEFRGLTQDPYHAAAQDRVPDAPPDSPGLSDSRSMLMTLTKSGGGSGDSTDNDIALGLNEKFGKGKEGHGNGIGENWGTGDGGFGLAPFGPQGGGIFTARPIGGRVNKIVFLCDSSGSMMTKFDALRVELRKAIDHLQPTQQFDIIFFSEDRYVALDNQLQHALPENKRKAYTLVEGMSPHSTSDPIPGLRAAFATGPELIFMLTDGDFPNNAAVREEVRKLNVNKKVIINTIAFMDRGDEYETLLKQIADDTRGTFKFVSQQELNP